MGIMKMLNFSLVLILVCFFTINPVRNGFSELHDKSAEKVARVLQGKPMSDAVKQLQKMDPGEAAKVLKHMPTRFKKKYSKSQNHFSPTNPEDKLKPFFIFIPTKIENLTPTYDILPDATKSGQETVQIEPPIVIEPGENILPSLDDIKPITLEYPIHEPAVDALFVHPEYHLYAGESDLGPLLYVAAGGAAVLMVVLAVAEIGSVGTASPIVIPAEIALAGFIGFVFLNNDSELNTEGSQMISFEHGGETYNTYCWFDGENIACEEPIKG